jgi:hypothetical protein
VNCICGCRLSVADHGGVCVNCARDRATKGPRMCRETGCTNDARPGLWRCAECARVARMQLDELPRDEWRSGTLWA